MILRSLLFGCALGLMVPVAGECIEKAGLNPFEAGANAYGTALGCAEAPEPHSRLGADARHPISQGEAN